MEDNLFPKTLEAALSCEASQWVLGDALLKECGPPSDSSANNGSTALLNDAREMLLANGIEYAVVTLRKMRDLSHAFPPDKRLSGVSWSVHLAYQEFPRLLRNWGKKNPGQTMTVAVAKAEVAKHKAAVEARNRKHAESQKPEQEETQETTGTVTTASDNPAPTEQPDTPVDLPPVGVPHEEPEPDTQPEPLGNGEDRITEAPEDVTREDRMVRELEDVWAALTATHSHLKSGKATDLWREQIAGLMVDIRSELTGIMQQLRPELREIKERESSRQVSQNRVASNSGGDNVIPLAASPSIN